MKTMNYLILEGSKTTNKESFLREIGLLLNFPDYYGHNWDALNDCLTDITNINNWKSKDPDSVEDVIDENTKINIIWLDPLDFSKYNYADFLVALDILKEVNSDESNPLQFVLASSVSNINMS